MRIVLVEDHAAFREALGTFLEEAPDFEVVAKLGSLAETNGIASVRIDVAIVDIRLPDGDGIDLVRQLREESPQVKTLVLTGILDPKVEVLAKESGADEVLFKSVGILQIADAIRRIA